MARVGRCVLAFSATLFYLFLCSSCSVLVLCSAGALLRSFAFPVSPPCTRPPPTSPTSFPPSSSTTNHLLQRNSAQCSISYVPFRM